MRESLQPTALSSNISNSLTENTQFLSIPLHPNLKAIEFKISKGKPSDIKVLIQDLNKIINKPTVLPVTVTYPNTR